MFFPVGDCRTMSINTQHEATPPVHGCGRFDRNTKLRLTQPTPSSLYSCLHRACAVGSFTYEYYVLAFSVEAIWALFPRGLGRFYPPNYNAVPISPTLHENDGLISGTTLATLDFIRPRPTDVKFGEKWEKKGAKQPTRHTQTAQPQQQRYN